MSESADVEPSGRADIWIEKYRPQYLEDIVGHDDIVARLQSYVERDELPNLMFGGPAGTGKCLTGDTPVITNDGISRIEDVVGDPAGFETAPPDLSVLSIDDSGDFDFQSPSHVFSKTTESVIEVKTRDGCDSTVTPEHPFLVLNGDGFEWKPAERLSPGDRVVRPLSIPTQEKRTTRWFEQMDPERIHAKVTDSFAEKHRIPKEEEFVGKKRAVVRHLRKGESTSEIVRNTGISRKTVRFYMREAVEVDLQEVSNECRLDYLRNLDISEEELRNNIIKIRYVNRFNLRSQPIIPPWKLTPSLAYFLGMTLAEAQVENSRVKYYNTNIQFLDQYAEAIKDSFGIEPRRGISDKGVPFVVAPGRTLTSFLEACFPAFNDDSPSVSGPIMQAPPEFRARFLRAFFDAEGHVTRRGIIEITQKDSDLITLVTYLLSSLGIPSRRKTEMKAATNGSNIPREYDTLYISGKSHLAQFSERVGFDDHEKARRLENCLDRDSNPNHDTIPTQSAVDNLCDALHLRKGRYIDDSRNPENTARVHYLDSLDRLLTDASRKLEEAQVCLERLENSTEALHAVGDLPLVWESNRTEMLGVQERRAITRNTGIRGDNLLTYADGRRHPRVNRVLDLLTHLNVDVNEEAITQSQHELQTIIDTLDIPYSLLAQSTEILGRDVRNVLTNDNHDLRTLTRLVTVAERIEEEINEMLCLEVLSDLSHLELLTQSNLYFDEVVQTERSEEKCRVYDLTVPGDRNYVAGAVPTIMHNTTSAQAIARELYGDDWQENFLELNASDDRGIDIVRGRIKDFARSSFGGHGYRIIFLDEADSLTADAQSALRRTMEQFSHNTRFILSCNYSSKIIDPIQSRCAVFRFTAIPEDAIAERVREIAAIEDIEVTEDGLDAIVYAANGDMRQAINALQAAAVLGETVDEDTVYTLTSTARPEIVEEMVSAAVDGDFLSARATLDRLLDDAGLAGGDVIDHLHRSVWDVGLEDRTAVDVLERIGEADYRISEGANERIQLEALLASIASNAAES